MIRLTDMEKWRFWLREFGVSATHIKRIRNRKVWDHI